MAQVHVLFQIGLLITHFKPLIVKCYLRIIKNYLFSLLTLRNSYDLGRVACSINITQDDKRHYKPIS